METPKNARVSITTRNPTPRLSERKKSLFATKEESQRDILEGIAPLEDETSQTKNGSIKSLLILNEKPKSLRFFSDDDQMADSFVSVDKSPTRRSLRLKPKLDTASAPQCRRSPRNSKVCSSIMEKEEHGKENIPLSKDLCRRSPRHSTIENNLGNKRKQTEKHIPVNMEPEDHLQLLFDSSMNLDGSSKTRESNEKIMVSKTVDELLNTEKDARKRSQDYSTSTSTTLSPKRKIHRMEGEILTPGKISIPTKSFYSNAKTSPPIFKTSVSPTTRVTPITSGKTYRYQRKGPETINKGVMHKIRRKPKLTSTYSSVDIDNILNNLRNEKLRKIITSKREQKIQIEKIHRIFKDSQNPIEMARPLSAISKSIAYNNNNNNDEKVTDEKPCNYSDAASISGDFEFSDIECDSEIIDDDVNEDNTSVGNLETEEVIPLITKSADNEDSINKKRKFFKSGHSTNTRMEVTITENIKASVCNGKISLVEKKKQIRRRIKLKNSNVNEFSDEQATVDAILKNLDDTTCGDTSAIMNNISNSNMDECSNSNIDIFDVQLDDEADYSDFRNRLPYNTSDPELIEQQNLLLDFLINNNICNEENFQIFIADPDNHKEEASRIVDQVIVVVNEQDAFRQRIPYNTTDPETIDQQHKIVDFLIENDICTEENFNIFIVNYENRCDEAELIVQEVLKKKFGDKDIVFEIANSNSRDNPAQSDYGMEVEIGNQNKSEVRTLNHEKILEQMSTTDDINITAASAKPEKLYPIFESAKYKPLVHKFTRKTPRIITGGFGLNQYQIDAGQKNFGPQQCKQCGLVYTVHEPEEEKLHRDYHSSLHVLRYKGWIDEDIVNVFPEWSPDGKIIKIKDNSPYKRRERLMDVLKVVDKELGIYSYIVPKSYVAYFAVRKFQIVGLCLVHPLQKANKYICINGIDCCTEEEFDVKCGISRIWVSPLHRRLNIGTKLIQAVQSNTIFGAEIPLDKIAFSAPTESGKNFARKITKMDNFLVYQ